VNSVLLHKRGKKPIHNTKKQAYLHPLFRTMRYPFLLLSAYIIFLQSCGNLVENRANIRADEFNRKALVFQNNGVLDSAIIYYKKALATPQLGTEHKAVMLRNLGNAFSDNGNTDSAKATYLRVLPLCEENSYLRLVVQSDVDLMNGNVGRALRQLELAVKMPEADVACFNLLGLIYLGDYDTTYYNVEKAIDYNREAMNKDYGNITIWLLMRSYFENEEHENAYRLARELYDRNPNYEDYIYAMAVLGYETDDLVKAKEMANKLIAADSSYYLDLYYIVEEPET
jgi:tetratricopeptide (TPR) repeat protein